MPVQVSAQRTAGARSNRHQTRPRHVPRSSLPSDPRDRRHRNHPDLKMPRTARGLERALAKHVLLLECDGFDLARDYEPHEFETGLTGAAKTGKQHIRPDFHLRDYWDGLDIYIEVTQGNDEIVARKRSKARGAMRVARSYGHTLAILVFDRPVIERMLAGTSDLATEVEKGLAELGELTTAQQPLL